MHGLNQYDSKARMQEFQIPHFTTRDPLAEKYYDLSLYGYCNGNPIRYWDPSGMNPEENGLNAIWNWLKDTFTPKIEPQDIPKDEKEREKVIEEQKKKKADESEVSTEVDESMTSEAVASGLFVTGVLLADDPTGVGTVDDIIIPFIWAGVTGIAVYEEVTKPDKATNYSLDASKKKKKSSAESNYGKNGKKHTKNKLKKTES